MKSKVTFSDVASDEKTIVYGREEIIPFQPVWRIFSEIKKLASSTVPFYKLSLEPL